MLTIYAIPNCDTVKKARKWLEEHAIAYQFHDYKKAGVPEEKLRAWVQAKGWEVICNQRGMTWRRLSDAEKAAITTPDAAIALMLQSPSVIKRPIIEGAPTLLVGFDITEYQHALR
jgi:arsenate reductase